MRSERLLWVCAVKRHFPIAMIEGPVSYPPMTQIPKQMGR
jgi:hypothetical protein